MTSRVRVKAITKMTGGADLTGMFEEMLGLKDAKQRIIVPKYVLVRNTLRDIYKVLLQFCNMILPNYQEFSADIDAIKDFAEELKASTELKYDTPENEEPYYLLSNAKINNLYKELKSNNYVKSVIVLCSTLKRHSSAFADTKNMKENFINQEPGLSFRMFDFSPLDFKKMWAMNNTTSMIKKYVLTVFSVLYKHSTTIYKTVTSADVDLDEFSEAMIDALKSIKKTPALSRCKSAFTRIEQSLDLLKVNFDGYYRQSIAAENPSMIITNFIVDVSNQGNADASLAREFRLIIKYLKETGNKTGKIQNPGIKKVFAMLNKQFSMMEKKTPLGDTKDDIEFECENVEDNNNVDSNVDNSDNNNNVNNYTTNDTKSDTDIDDDTDTKYLDASIDNDASTEDALPPTLDTITEEDEFSVMAEKQTKRIMKQISKSSKKHKKKSHKQTSASSSTAISASSSSASDS